MAEVQQSRRGFIKGLASLCTLAWGTMASCPAALARTAADALDRIRGRIVHRGDPEYPLWRAGMSWYIFKPERYPDTLIRAGSEQDAVEAINYARGKGMKVAVRSTGHNPARSVLRNGGILLDLSRLRAIEIDAAGRTAWVKPGIRAEELLHETTRHGLAFPAAHTGIVGLGGYLPGGGLGWNMPEYGIACRSILAAEIILADGSRVNASADEYPDLHWAIRGAGPGFFGAALRYKLQLYPLHRAIILNRYVIPVAKMAEAMAMFQEIGENSEKRLETFIKVGRFHPADRPYPERDLVCTVGFFAFGDDGRDADLLMKPVRDSGIAGISIVRKENIPLDYEGLYRPPATDYSSPNRTAVENIWTDDPGQCLMLLTDKMQNDPPASPRSFLLTGWAFNSTMEDPSSCIKTAARHYLSWYMIAEQENHIAPNHRWMDESLEMLRHLTKGHYINEIDPGRYPQQVQNCFSRESWVRLGGLRKQYDPGGVFHTWLGHT